MWIESPKKDEIFNTAAEMTDAGQRQEYLDEACGDDHQLREEIEDLLEQDLKVGSFLELPPTARGRRLSQAANSVLDSSTPS